MGRRTTTTPPNARRTLTVIGEIGYPGSLDRLSAIYNTSTDHEFRALLEKAMARGREQRRR